MQLFRGGSASWHGTAGVAPGRSRSGALAAGTYSITARHGRGRQRQRRLGCADHHVDTTGPAASVPDLVAASDSGSSSTDNVTNVTTPTFTGTAEANSTVVLLEGRPCWDDHGGWKWRPGHHQPVRPTARSITARATDAAGNISADLRRPDRHHRHHRRRPCRSAPRPPRSPRAAQSPTRVTYYGRPLQLQHPVGRRRHAEPDRHRATPRSPFPGPAQRHGDAVGHHRRRHPGDLPGRRHRHGHRRQQRRGGGPSATFAVDDTPPAAPRSAGHNGRRGHRHLRHGRPHQGHHPDVHRRGGGRQRRDDPGGRVARGSATATGGSYTSPPPPWPPARTPSRRRPRTPPATSRPPPPP